MKTFDEIVAQEPLYMNDFACRSDVFSEFGEDEDESIKILYASYEYISYSGDAWVLFEQDGKLFEVNGSHCSCYGLEGQWMPDEVMLAELQNRMTKGNFGYGDRGLYEFLGVELKNNY